MNREETKKAIEVMQAYVDGHEVGFANVGEDVWAKKTASIMWDFVHYRYRIKPKPREFVLELNTDGTVRNTLEAGEEPWFDGAVHIKVREIL